MADPRKREQDTGERSRLRHMFVEDGRALLSTLRNFLDRISTEGYGTREFNSAFRAVHSLKSEASFLEFSDVSGAAHVLESELSSLRKKTYKAGERLDEAVQQRIADAVYELERVVRRRMSYLEKDSREQGGALAASRSLVESTEAAVVPISDGSDRLLELGERERAVLRDARRHGERLCQVIVKVSESEPLTYARVYLIINNLESVVNVVRTVPSPETVGRQSVRELNALITASVSEQEIRQALDVDQVEGIDLVPLEYDDVFDAAADRDTSGPGMLLGRSGVTLSLSPRNHELLSMYSYEMISQLDTLIARLDSSSDFARNMERDLKSTRRLADRVNSALMTTSLIRLSRIFDPLFRFVDRMASTAGKQVRLVASGEREQVFLPVGEVISDTLLHLIRNSIDHGIEPPDERRGANKPDIAVISVRARRSEGALSIVVSDDGRGVNEEAVQTEAQKQSVQGSSLLRLMTSPGVSTKASEDEVSGRGVGLDAVRHAVETLLGGSLKLENSPGYGVAITMRLPENARLLTVLVFTAGDRSIAVPSCQVQDTFALEAERVRQDSGGDYYYTTDDGVARVFSVARSGSAVERHEGYGILLSVEGRKGVLLADRLISEEVVVRRSDERNKVYSRTCEDLVPLFIPVSI